MITITAEIDRLRAMNVPDLVDRYTNLFGKPPRVKNREHLWRRCAWKLQEIRVGGLSAKAKERLEELIAEIDLPLREKTRTVSGVLKKDRSPDDPVPGTLFTRVWKGQEIRVLVRENGYECNGELYRSLTAVARAITGSKWNGRLFCGLTSRKKAR